LKFTPNIPTGPLNSSGPVRLGIHQQPYWLIKIDPDNQPRINGGPIARRGTVDGQAVIA
jgi:hypothetical protein